MGYLCVLCGRVAELLCMRCQVPAFCGAECQTRCSTEHQAACSPRARMQYSDALPLSVGQPMPLPSPEKLPWPVKRQAIVVAGYVRRAERRVLVCPAKPGYYVFFVLSAAGGGGEAVHFAQFEATVAAPLLHTTVLLKAPGEYKWILLQVPTVLRTQEELFAEYVINTAQHLDAVVCSGTLRIWPKHSSTRALSLVMWSCNQPFLSGHTVSTVAPQSAAKFAWYAEAIDRLQPNLVMGLGDTMYTDSAGCLNWVRLLLSHADWAQHTELLLQLLRESYRRFWAFEDFLRVLYNHPHIFTWDDHEIRDGYGSEPAADRRQRPLAQSARRVAEDFILGIGPRVRQGVDGVDAHQSTQLSPNTALWIFDTRTSREYDTRIISEQQWGDFTAFLQELAASTQLLLISITVPLIHLKLDWQERLATLTDFSQHIIGIRDDIRDSWRAGSNAVHLARMIELLRQLHRRRPTLEIAIVSGDVHTGNAFSFQPPGFAKPLYQFTSSALTNGNYLPAAIAKLIVLGAEGEDPILGSVRRLWPEVEESNFLSCTVETGEARFTLHGFPSRKLDYRIKLQ